MKPWGASGLAGRICLAGWFLAAGSAFSPAAAGEDDGVPAAPPAMSFLQAVVLGAVEGLTEYVPVSSTGHLVVLQRAMGLHDAGSESGPADAYAIAIQAGAILAVLGLYRRRIGSIWRGLLAGRDPAGRRIGICLGAAFLPAAALGIIARGWIKSALFGIWPIVAAWAAGGAALLILCRRGPGRPQDGEGASLERMGLRQAWIVGLAQCLALWPGVSRSLATIGGGLVAGLGVPAAVEFSFLLGLITLGAATVFEAACSGPAIFEAYGWARPMVGLLTAFGFAVLSIRWMIRYLQRHSLRIFGWYRIGIAALAALAALAGWI